ncbi:hypothetical protein RYH80_01725 [Halobaculum sp. MBLA0147]|uniref:hypothetical protein n=1 Tax=Halobaculum sp. MBLA0147 TaxID=3079934 RepID=UPI003526B459
MNGVTVQYELVDEVISYLDLRGGIRILVDGERVNRLRDEAAHESNREWEPEYVGELVWKDIGGVVRVATRLASGECEVWEREQLDLSPGMGVFAFEPVSAQDLVVSYWIPAGDDIPTVTPESGRGYVVRRCQFCRSVRDTAHEYLDEVEAMGIEFGRSAFEEYRTALDELDTALETCRETTPETRF